MCLPTSMYRVIAYSSAPRGELKHSMKDSMTLSAHAHVIMTHWIFSVIGNMMTESFEHSVGNLSKSRIHTPKILKGYVSSLMI